MTSINLSIDQNTLVSEMILNNHQLILILERFGIELGVQNKTVADICTEKKISIDIFITIINLHNKSFTDTKLAYNFTDIEQIINYLKISHRYYSNEVFPEIVKNIHKISEFNKKPEIMMVETFFNNYKKEVDQHFNYEDKTVFPYIIDLFNADDSNVSRKNYSVTVYKDHHDDIEEKLDDLKKLLIQHLPSSNDSKLRRKILFDLFNFEQDLSVHSEIENDILIPLVEKMEKQI